MGRRALRIGAAALGPVAALVWIACGSSYDGDGGEPDAGLEEVRPRDASIKDTAKPDVDADAPAPCDPGAPFTNVAAAPGKINGLLDDGFPTLTDDELTMYFQRSALGGGENPKFFVAVRSSALVDFGDPIEVAELTDGAFNNFPAISPSGDVLYFTSAPALGGKADLKKATRGAMGRFDAAVPVTALNTADDDTFPSVFGRGEELWFGRNADGGPYHLHRSVVLTGGGFTNPQRINELEDPTAGEGTSASTRDGLTVYFSSSREGGAGGLDIWVARRQARSSPFSFVAVVPGASSTSEDAPAWLSADACRLYFTTTRLGSFDIFVASRNP